MFASSLANFWAHPAQSGALYLWIGIALILSFGLWFLFTTVPTNLRKYIIVGFTFIAGFVFVAEYLWPRPLGADFNTQEPNGFVEAVGFGLGKAIEPVGKIANILAGFILGLGIYSLLHVHINKIRRKAKDWGFSVVLLVSLVSMFFVGIMDWRQRDFIDTDGLLVDQANWGMFQWANDMMFDGMYQQMDAAMFSMIAFFILSAAFRAFRIRSVEATVMMVSALILMLNLLGLLTYAWGNGIDNLVNSSGATFLLNFKLTEIANWLRANMQTPAIRAIEFGVGLGALAMGLRIWLGLEKGGVSA